MVFEHKYATCSIIVAKAELLVIEIKLSWLMRSIVIRSTRLRSDKTDKILACHIGWVKTSIFWPQKKNSHALILHGTSLLLVKGYCKKKVLIKKSKSCWLNYYWFLQGKHPIWVAIASFVLYNLLRLSKSPKQSLPPSIYWSSPS